MRKQAPLASARREWCAVLCCALRALRALRAGPREGVGGGHMMRSIWPSHAVACVVWLPGARVPAGATFCVARMRKEPRQARCGASAAREPHRGYDTPGEPGAGRSGVPEHAAGLRGVACRLQFAYWARVARLGSLVLF